MGMKVCKNDIKNSIRNELKCDYGFIKNLIKGGRIQALQDAYLDGIDDPKDIMEIIYEEYNDYCSIWGMDFEADNRNNKEYLHR